MSTTTRPRASGQKFSPSISRLAWSRASPWSFSGTNWARFSRSAGGVIGQTLAMEGVFSFFPGIFVSRIVHLRRETVESLDALALGIPSLPGFLDVGILHHRDRRLDAPSPASACNRTS